MPHHADQPDAARPSRRALVGGGLALAAAGLSARAARAQRLLVEPEHDVTYLEDFDELWRTLGDRYCYFDGKKTDWGAVGRLYRPMAATVAGDEAFGDLVDAVCRELYDAHTYRHAEQKTGLARGPYYDLWVEPAAGGSAVVTSVRDGRSAAASGIRVGDRITAIDGVPLTSASAPFLPRCLTEEDPAATAFALNVAVSGRVGVPRRLSLLDAGGAARSVVLPVMARPDLPDVESRTLPGGFGYIAIHSFADDKVVAGFDAALAGFRSAPGLILDVRGNGGGDTALAKPIMGRFITEAKPYARMRRRDGVTLGPFWTEMVEPRGPFTYAAPVVVLTSRWSASMAEGFPMGMRGIGRATIVGTRMMRVGAAVFPLRMDRTGMQIQYSAEPVYDARYRPRWLLEPDVPVVGGADILAAGIAVLRREAGRDGSARRGVPGG